MRHLIIAGMLFSSLGTASASPGKLSGEVSLQYRYFPEQGEYGNDIQHHSALVFQPEYSASWDNDRTVFTFVPYARYDRYDDERNLADIREFSLVTAWPSLELRIGISKVFWGVTESQHLVDVINQTDLAENPDGESKLGQPMLNMTWVTAAGNVDLFILPYFRERTFTGENGRFRGPLLIDTSNPVYTHEDKNEHVDYAARWSGSYHDLEWGLSYFDGTDRDPGFVPDLLAGTLTPVYGQSTRYGLELQYLYKDLLLKSEYINKRSEIHNDYRAATAGFEYTFVNVYKGADIGFLYEWLYDNRDENTPSGFHDASFIGSRIAFNNESSSQLLLGSVLDNETSDMIIFRLEASTRLAQSVSVEVEASSIGRPPENSLLSQFRHDDYIQLSLIVYF